MTASPNATVDAGDSYSPQLRTALILSGVGAEGAYHAGVLRALQEAGVKIDVVAGRGIGAVGALFAAIDGAPSLWNDRGFWRSDGVRSLYDWRPAVRLAGAAALVSIAIVAIPLLAMAVGAVVFPIDFVARMIGIGGAGGLVGAYVALAQEAFGPAGFPTWLPRLVVIVLGAAAGAMLVGGLVGATGRRRRGAIWWRALPAPISQAPLVAHSWRVLWDLLRGAAALAQPGAEELAQRYAELLADNLGQPGFRELLIVAHDLDAHRDVVFALVAESRRRDLIRRPSSAAAEARRAEVLDLAGAARVHLADAIAASLSVPVATDPHPLTFAPEAYWRGETHRVCDRPGALARLVDELVALGVDQAILVSAAPELTGPHALAAGRLDPRGRLGEYLQSAESAALRDAARAASPSLRLFTIRPAHNPIGPFDFGGGYDERSDRRQPLGESINRGYEDAYHQFIEPVVGASGEQVGQGASG